MRPSGGWRARLALLCAALAFPAAPAAAAAAPSANVAALQAALYARGTYAGNVDGIRGPATARAVRAFQRRAGLAVDGIAGPRTRHALGRIGRHLYGTRVMRHGMVGWDVAVLQFELESHGFPCRGVDGGYGFHTVEAVARAQAHFGLSVDGVAGPGTWRALSLPPGRAPFRMLRPIDAPVGDPYGPRGTGWHPGLDFPASYGTSIRAAASGQVVVAGTIGGGYGNGVILQHSLGVRTLYAHMSSVAVAAGSSVSAGQLIGRVGATGFATGPHLHWEVIVRGQNVDPMGALS
jgi:murein DD-endopeptidase MepM/ murein hydrolase activator NlpD